MNVSGHKCQAPYYQSSSQDESIVSYHNALVISVHTPEDGVTDINDINVKVVFTHPICKPMLTCPYHFDGECKYSEERCFYSHGYLVKFIELKEYKTVSYDNLHLNQLVLAKNLQTNIWYRAKIVNFNTREDKVIVQFETGEGRKGHTHSKSSNNSVEMELEDIYPLDNDEMSADPEDSDSDSVGEDTPEETFDKTKAIEVSLTNTPLDTRLGDWEKYTKGMGSKLMVKMGYVIGSGLGKNSEGRVDPVETYILPQGKSLDYCMNLREKFGSGGEDLFKMEKINQKIAMKEMKKSKRNYENAVKKEKQDVFGFLNKNLNQNTSASSAEKSSSSNLNSANTNLNVETFKISEKIKKYNKQLGELNKSLRRHENDQQSEMYKKLTREISIVNNQISALNTQDSNIHAHMKKEFNKKYLAKF